MTATRERPAAGALLRVVAVARPVRGRLVLALLLGSLAAASGVGLMAVSAWLVSRAAQRPPILTLTVAIVAVRALGIGRGVLRYAERLVSHDAALAMLADLRVTVYRRLEVLAPGGLAAFRSGDLLSRLVADVDALQDLVLRVLLPFETAALVTAGAVVLVGSLLPAAAATLAVAALVAGAGVPALATAVAARAERRIAPTLGELAASVVDLVQGAPELIAFEATDAPISAVLAADAELTRAQARSAAVGGAGAGLVVLAAGGAVVAGLLAGIPALRAGRLDGPALAVLVFTPLALFEVLGTLPAAAQVLPRLGASAERVVEVLDAPAPVREPARPRSLPVGPGHLRVTGLSAGWSPSGPDVLHGVDLDLPPGRRVAVVGRSGSGKSTLAAVLLRFLDPTAGRVTLDGADVTRLAADEVRTVVGLLTQEAHVFDSTLEENVRLARRDATAEQVRSALRRARLLEFVDGLPLGLATPVGEHGARLSGGQRQRLALARLLLLDPPVLVLDEPTEHLDEETADALTADLLALTRGRTTLLVTHRLAAVDGVDEVVVLEGGRVLDRGAPCAVLPRLRANRHPGGVPGG